MPGASEAQTRRIGELLEDRQVDQDWLTKHTARIERHGLSRPYATETISHLLRQPMADGSPPLPGFRVSTAQKDLIVKLLDDKVIPNPEYAAELRAVLGDRFRFCSQAAGAAIDYLLPCPGKVKPVTDAAGKALPKVPDGRYALTDPDGPTRYRLRTAHNGQTYLDRIDTHGATTWVKGEQASEVLAAIAADIAAAARLYSTVTNRCSDCDLLLTDPLSVRTGYGSKCRTDRGMAPAAQLTALLDALDTGTPVTATTRTIGNLTRNGYITGTGQITATGRHAADPHWRRSPDAPAQPPKPTPVIEAKDTIVIAGEKGRWTVEQIYPDGLRLECTRAIEVGGGYRRNGGGYEITVADFPITRATLIRKGNTEDDAIAELDRLYPLKTEDPAPADPADDDPDPDDNHSDAYTYEQDPEPVGAHELLFDL